MSEWHEQRDIVKWYRNKWPEHKQALRTSMSGLNLGRKGGIIMNQMRAQGLVAGESDMAILLPRGGYGCLVLEHKADGSRHTLSENQESYLDYHQTNGNCAVSTRGIEAAQAAISTYMDS